LLKKVEGQALGSLPANAGKPGELGDEIVNRPHRSRRRAVRWILHFAHLGLDQIRGSPLGLGHGGKDQVGEKLRIPALEGLRLDVQRTHGTTTIHLNPHQPRPRRRFHRASGKFRLKLLQPALDLLAELKEML